MNYQLYTKTILSQIIIGLHEANIAINECGAKINPDNVPIVIDFEIRTIGFANTPDSIKFSIPIRMQKKEKSNLGFK